jgi:peptidyl-prolyl cis-trans isomerase SurA
MKNVKTRNQLLLALCLASALPLVSTTAQAETVIVDSIVAIVEDDVVMASELRGRLEMVQANLQAQGREPPAQEAMVRDTLDRLILESIQLQKAQRAGVRISDSQLNQAVTRLAAQNRVSLEQFQQQLEAEGKSYVELREDIRRELVLQRVQQGSVNQRIQISEQEVDNFLESPDGRDLTSEEYHLVHALLEVPTEASAAQVAAAQAHVDALFARSESGDKFNVVLAESGDTYVFTGGDLGWRKRADLPSLFGDVAPTLAMGETAEPIRSANGFHLIYMAEKRGGQMVIPQTHARHNLLKPSAIRSDEETRALASDLRQQIINGAEFTELAKEFSEDIGSAQEGGDLGWASPGQMVGEFETVMTETPVGEVSQPFRSQFGWHILQVMERRDQDVTDTVAKNRAREYLHQRKYQEELDAWLRKIRDEAFVDIK